MVSELVAHLKKSTMCSDTRLPVTVLSRCLSVEKTTMLNHVDPSARTALPDAHLTWVCEAA